MTGIPAFKDGEIAYQTGKGITANPYDPDAPYTPEQYPGHHANWRAGWKHARAVDKFTRAQNLNAEPMTNGRNQHG